ncbi:MAG: SpoIIE family protein phosphatase [Leptospiraceae bacterium]|nr:SpoIIE family protein phosphatase [Leptospiraceae bacterium]
MRETTLKSLLTQKETSRYVISIRENLREIFLMVIREAIRSVGAKRGTIFLNDDNGNLHSILEDTTDSLALSIAEETLEGRKSTFIKKNSSWKGQVANESYIACYLGDKNESKDIGVILLEGIYHFENFSFSDFETIIVYSETLSLLLNEAFYEESNLEEIYLKFSTSLILLLHSTDNHQKNIRLEFLLKEVIRVSGLINSSVNLDILLRDVMESVKTVFKTESCSILLVDKERNDLYFHIVAGDKQEELSKIRVPMGKGIAGTVASSREPMIINDAQNDDRVYKVVDKESQFVTRNILAAPLVVNDEVIGIMEAINTIDRNNFNDEDIELFLSFSDAAALAIQKTRLVSDLERSNKELEKTVSELASLFELGLSINESKTVEELFLKSIHIIAREMNAFMACIFILSGSDRIEIKSLKDDSYEKTIENIPENSVIINSIRENSVFTHDNFIASEESGFIDALYLNGSSLIIPMQFSNGKPFGAISVSGHKSDVPYGHTHLRLLFTITSQFIKGYENLKLNQDMIAKKAIEKEIEITKEIQKNILPSKIPIGSNFELGVKSVAAKDVSGDFYDFYKYEDGQFSFLIADVSGKSLPAAIFMAMSSSIIRTISREHSRSPAELLQEANVLIYEDSQSGMFVTLFYISYNPAVSEIEFASAGHNDQIWIKSDNTYELIKGSGAPLGVIPSTKYTGGKFKVRAGDLVVLYTDGAIEEKNSLEEEYGLERFVNEIIKRKHLPSNQIIEEVFSDIQSFSTGMEQFDDFTVLIFKFNEDFQFRKTFPAQDKQIPRVRDFIIEAIKYKVLNETITEDILLCCDEASTNIVMHSYRDTNIRNPTFECAIKFSDESVQVLFRDKGNRFEREKVQKPSLVANLKGERKGGFGIFLMETLMDETIYRQTEDGYNEILLIKKIIPE